MNVLFNLFFFVLAFVLMEGMAWFSHKFIMHGPGWFLHADHHVPRGGFFQRNDAFFLIFAIPGFLLIAGGMAYGVNPAAAAGFGITAYGLAYFLVHDVFIHQRFKWFRNTQNPYLLAIRRAHKAHHKHTGKEDGECFGMLVVPLRYFREIKRNK
ncbi:MAG: sterol desaturase family protein [Flavobacteriales bacterium]|nr:sterol desaturase family protein [Flavobacteriales bacterium]MCB9448565.1 sterol desaturase family protein [Flavobacteriales bacterium]